MLSTLQHKRAGHPTSLLTVPVEPSTAPVVHPQDSNLPELFTAFQPLVHLYRSAHKAIEAKMDKPKLKATLQTDMQGGGAVEVTLSIASVRPQVKELALALSRHAISASHYS